MAGNDRWETILAQVEIREVLEQCFSSIDRRDFEMLRMCFTDEATVELLDGELTFNHIDDFIDHSRIMQRTNHSNHSLSNASITVSGDAATADSTAMAILALADTALHERILVRGLRYLDRLECSDAGWRIVYRRHIPLWQFAADSEVPDIPELA